jgi:hypothetical protein
MVSWGIVTICTAAVKSYQGLIIVRIFLGQFLCAEVEHLCQITDMMISDLNRYH